jgi:hypothetical protein
MNKTQMSVGFATIVYKDNLHGFPGSQTHLWIEEQYMCIHPQQTLKKFLLVTWWMRSFLLQ